jgi:hypothetical protein
MPSTSAADNKPHHVIRRDCVLIELLPFSRKSWTDQCSLVRHIAFTRSAKVRHIAALQIFYRFRQTDAEFGG